MLGQSLPTSSNSSIRESSSSSSPKQGREPKEMDTVSRSHNLRNKPYSLYYSRLLPHHLPLCNMDYLLHNISENCNRTPQFHNSCQHEDNTSSLMYNFVHRICVCTLRDNNPGQDTLGNQPDNRDCTDYPGYSKYHLHHSNIL
eukprot:TRINITY_DN28444_c0_g1_i1.p1 TRINITY_DN28444_c0_g1~~TRINITY_DN28444_c0_g1_i1.p1  ORF type:complete len:143 (+),score=18.25 TRINITY_DN28444_c0_g1_i1:134-562(+)